MRPNTLALSRTPPRSAQGGSVGVSHAASLTFGLGGSLVGAFLGAAISPRWGMLFGAIGGFYLGATILPRQGAVSP
jgi:hypothetical protein